MTYKEQHSKLPTKTHFSTFTEKDYPYVSYIYTIICKEPIHFKPRSGKTIHFPIKNYLNLHFELEDNTKFYPSTPYTYFLQKIKDIFHFVDMIVNDKNKDSSATIIQNFTSHPATLPRGIIGYIETPITQTTPPHDRVQDVNSLIHSVIHDLNLKPLCTLLHDNIKFQWTPELEKIFQDVKNAMTADTKLTIPNKKHPFFIIVDASLVGLGAVLFQINETNKMKIISYKSRIPNTQEQKLSTLDRELLAIVYALQLYEFLIFGSPHPIYIFTDHKPLLHCFAKRETLVLDFIEHKCNQQNFPNCKIIHTPGKNLTVADMLSRTFTFTKEQLQEHQLRHKQLPPQIDFSIMKDNQLKPVNYLVKHEEIECNQKNDCHPILADCGDDQFSIRINNKGEDIHIKPLDSLSFKSIVPFESKYKRPTKNQTKSLLQQSTILNNTDILSDDDEPTQPQDVKNQKSNILKEQTLAIQYPTKSDYYNQQVPFFDPSFFKYKKHFHYFFLPENTQITIETIISQQKQDPVLQKVFHWLTTKDKPLRIDPIIASNSFLLVYYKLFNQLYINHETKIIPIDYPNLHDSNLSQRDKTCLPFKLFHAACNKLQELKYPLKLLTNFFSYHI